MFGLNKTKIAYSRDAFPRVERDKRDRLEREREREREMSKIQEMELWLIA